MEIKVFIDGEELQVAPWVRSILEQKAKKLRKVKAAAEVKP